MPPKATSRPPLTHFLCLPLVTRDSKPQLQNALEAFASEITQKADPATAHVGARIGLPGKAVRPVGTLHLTLGVMSLTTQARVNEALTLLQSINVHELLETFRLGGKGSDGASAQKEESNPAASTEDAGVQHQDPKHDAAAEPRIPTTAHPLQVSLRGLTPMHSPTSTSILYSSPICRTHDLPSLCQSLVSLFRAAGLMLPDARPLLLHATILNTIYVPKVRQASGRAGHGKHKAKLTIDASGVLDRFAEHVWMEDCVLEKVAICRMGAKVVEDGGEEYVEEGARALLG
ncbi:hypothetical protein BP6252_03230 [Coleophoma cylindrospora]|uniref:A-kinase anchor protein 7-like phosphoesterase domain-containing protein n=1 Tax=Coleophoma cylindrospora TaxID=1849047 RepID=A0A3D8S760_9HELO|nr:hypothetical protein BP6252_03230 [Coleophoma cylindrospora]